MFLEQLETNPAQYLPDIQDGQLSGTVVSIDLNRPMAKSWQNCASILWPRACR